MPKNKGVDHVTVFKFLSATVLFGISYMDHIFSPLIWALLVLIILDILLNVHKEGQQLQKIGSAFATLGGADLFSNTNLFSLNVIHGLVAVMVLAYLQIVVPELLTFIKKLKGLSTQSKAEIILALQAENELLKQKAESQEKLSTEEGQSKVVISK